MDLKKYLSVLFILILSGSAFGQIESKGIPYIKNFTRAEYDGNAQTWSIVQDDRGILYFANHTYILEYDGNTWRKIFLPGDPTIYSMSKDNTGRIFVGAGNGELGYLEVAEDGNMKYRSLKDKIPEDKREFTRVIYITDGPDNEMIFLTPLIAYIYKNDTINAIDIRKPENIFIKPYKVNDQLFIQEKGLGIHEYKNGELTFLKGSEIYANKWATGVFPSTNKDMFITTWQDSVFVYSNGELKSIEKNPIFGLLYSYDKFNDSYYAGGLYGRGMIIMDNKLNIMKHLSTNNGLQNNTIYNVFTDKDRGIWIGTNDGISVIYPDLPYSVFSGNANLNEAVYSSKFYKGKLYIGSSVGIFYNDFKKKNSVEGEKFELIENEKGNVYIWQIDTAKNSLLCASARGLFEIKDNKAILIGPDASVKNFIRLKKNPNNILTIGNGLTLFSFKNGKWEYGHTIKNFKGDYRHIVEDNDGSFWISDRSKGILQIRIDQELDSVIQETAFSVENGLPDILNNYVFKVDNRIIFTTTKGFYIYDKGLNKFIKDPEFENIFDRDISITKLHQAKNGNIWFKEELDDPKIKNKKHWELGLIKKVDGKYEIIKTPFYKLKNRINSINQISENELVVGTETGFVLYNLDSKKEFEKPFNTLIRRVEFIKNDSLLFGGAFSDMENKIVLLQDPDKIPKISHEYNDLRFSFASNFFEESEKTLYKFILQGNDKEWTDWKSITSKEYSNLAPGAYTFIVKAKNLYNVESDVAEYTFEIIPPWYQTFWAYIGYFILFILFIWGVIQLSIFRLKKQRENLKRIVEERTQEIQIQKEEIEAKNETLSEQNEEIIQKNNSITASINYAKRIQEAMLPLKEKISAGLKENFILFKPRDIVSGDFYWYAERGNKIIYTAVDCTGHGVPGALMSMIGSEILTTIINNNILKSDEILERMNESVVKILKQETEGFSQDGMDMALCVIDTENKTVDFAGAKNPLVFINNGKLTQIKASRHGIGGYQQEAKDFDSHQIKYESPTWFYMFTDGFQDQFGGPNDRKFMIKRLKELLTDIHYKSMQEQHDILNKTINDWMIGTAQTDDILLTCFKL